jgi:hypothetical protein
MSPARDSMSTPSGARTSSDRVGDSNLHQQRRTLLHDVTFVAVTKLVSISGSFGRFFIRIQAWILHLCYSAKQFQLHKFIAPNRMGSGNE